MTSQTERKLVVVGDSGVGKTCLLFTLTGTFLEWYLPNVPLWQNRVADIIVDDRVVALELWDTQAHESYDHLRPVNYAYVDVILVCFRIDCPDSLNNIYEKWISEIMHYCDEVPLLLVGCKKDLRKDPEAIERLREENQRFVSSEEGRIAAQKMGAKHYFECSAKTGEGVQDVFLGAARVALFSRSNTFKQKRQCVVF